MQYSVFIGLDVSKESVDFVVLEHEDRRFHMHVGNDKKGFSSFYKRLLKDVKASKEHLLFCLEHTGIYCNPFLEFAAREGLTVWMEDASKIKAYHGLERDKNDAIDAYRIAEYAFSKRHKVKPWVAPRKIISQLKSMIKLRDRLVTSKKRLVNPLQEEKRYGNRDWAKEHEKLIKPIVAQTEKKIKEVEQQIQQLIDEDDHLKALYEQVSSVKGVGLIVAANTIVVTNEFKQITDPKKMACHCGVAPFKKDSGKSVRGRSKVSHRANKSMKTLLNLAARSAVASKGELRDFYHRKVVEDGKNKMSALNAVRNKIILRIFACVRDGRKYENTYTHALA